ncbi:MAG: hypothetical protein QW705_03695 [Zestosphaera sp.]
MKGVEVYYIPVSGVTRFEDALDMFKRGLLEGVRETSRRGQPPHKNKDQLLCWCYYFLH